MPEAAAMNEFNQKVIEEFRANGGKVGGMFEGAPMLLLTSTGAKSGRQLTTPVVYTRDGDRLVVIASKAGAPTNPAWYHNLVANPEVTVEVGSETIPMRAVVTQGAERTRLYDAQAALMPNFADYAKQTTRVIPVIALERMT
ncbi:MAG TPA: nitroreductase family deazaflavin-dependent oxidoreductase [Acidimicrobiales bacterium]